MAVGWAVFSSPKRLMYLGWSRFKGEFLCHSLFLGSVIKTQANPFSRDTHDLRHCQGEPSMYKSSLRSVYGSTNYTIPCSETGVNSVDLDLSSADSPQFPL